MATSEQLEIYKQRYETYRHLDKLRWQMVQLSVAVVPLALAFTIRAGSTPPSWAWAVIGVFLVLCAVVMERIRHGINGNAKVLAKVASDIGDTDQPKPGKAISSTSFWVALTIGSFGLGSIITAVVKLYGD